MKVDIPFPTQMAEQGSVEGVVNALLMHAAWQETHRVDQASWRGTESILTSNLELSSFRTSAHVSYGHSLNRPSSETPCTLRARHRNYNFQDDNARDRPARVTRDFIQQNNRGYAVPSS
jgi:hypothetical protein